jgi:hypothetical protein
VLSPAGDPAVLQPEGQRPADGTEEDHQLAKQSTGLDAGQVIRWKSWHRWTAICLLAYIYLAVVVAVQRQQEADSDLEAGLIQVTVPELLRLAATNSDAQKYLHGNPCTIILAS